MSDDEVRWLWRACDDVGEPFGPMVKLLLITGARLRECAEMTRSELEGPTWTILGSRTKNKRTHPDRMELKKFCSNCRCHRRSSSGAISTVMTFFCVSISMMPGGFDCTSLRVGSRPNLARNCWHSRLSMKLAASRAALGCGALALIETCPNISVTGSSGKTSIGPPASFTFIVRLT